MGALLVSFNHPFVIISHSAYLLALRHPLVGRGVMTWGGSEHLLPGGMQVEPLQARDTVEQILLLNGKWNGCGHCRQALAKSQGTSGAHGHIPLQ